MATDERLVPFGLGFICARTARPTWYGHLDTRDMLVDVELITGGAGND